MELGWYSEETKAFRNWVKYALIISIVILFIILVYPEEIFPYSEIILAILLSIGINILLDILLHYKMITTIYYDNIIIYFGDNSWNKIKIPLQNIENSEIVEYSLKQFRGWGIKTGKFRGNNTLLLALVGEKGVLIVLKDPIKHLFSKFKQILIGSNQPKKLYEAITKY